MKRTIIKLIVIAIVAIFNLNGMAQKTVTYTFKGRAQGYILPAKPIDLVASGAIPAGVTVSNIYITKDADDNDVENEYTPGDERINEVDMDGFLGSALLTEYTVQPSTTAHIHFDGFRYEIAGIQWNRCSEIAILTSKGTTEAKDYSNGTIGSFVFSTAGEENYSTGGELFYHTRDFLPGFDYATKKPSGLSMLEIDCTSKQAQHGIAIKNFNITYYEPVITITHTKDQFASGATGVDAKDYITAHISNHQGAFTNAEIQFEVVGAAGVASVVKGELDGDGKATATVTAGNDGIATIVAKIVYAGAVVAKTSYKVQVGKKNGFNYESETNWDDNSNPGNSDVATWGSGSGENNITITAGASPTNPQVTTNTLDNLSSARQYRYRQRIIEMSYSLDIPSYTKIKRGIGLTCTSSYTNGTGETVISEIRDFDDSHVSGNFNPLSATSPYICFASNSTDKGDVVWTFNNSESATPISATKYLSLRCALRRPTMLAYPAGTWSFSYSDVAKAEKFTDPFVFDYYSTITFDANGGTGTTMATQKINQEVVQSEVNTTKGGIYNDIPATTEGTALNALTYSKDGYVFAGWKDTKDGKLYSDQDIYCPYDAEGECGKGPRTLVAQWNKIPDPDDLTDPDVDYLVYAVFANGGTFGSKDHLEGVFVTGQNVSIAEITSPATRTGGYTLNGYYDAPEGGTMLFDKSGAIQNNATTQEYYFTADGKWKATADVYLYAQWEKPVSQVIRTITFDANGGTIDGTTKQVTVGESDNNNVSDLNPSYTGKKFAGWYTNESGNGDGNIMAYNANGESVVLESMSKDPVTGANVASLIPVNEHFFNNIYKYTGNQAPFNNNIRLYAHWVDDGVTLTFDEGTKSSTNTATYKIGEGSKLSMDSPAYELTEYDFVKVKRTLKTNAWNTVCFPCDIYKDQVSALFENVMQLNSFEIEDGGIRLLFKEVNIMAAGVPYFVQMKSGFPTSGTPEANDEAYVSDQDGDNVTEITLENVQVNKTPGKITIEDGDTKVIMYGSYTTEYHIGDQTKGWSTDYDYYYLQNDKFYVSGGKYEFDGEHKTVWGNNQGFRVYFAVKNGSLGGDAATFRMFIDLEGFDDEIPTIIEGVEAESEGGQMGVIYDLSGRRRNTTPRQGVYITNGKKFVVSNKRYEK